MTSELLNPCSGIFAIAWPTSVTPALGNVERGTRYAYHHHTRDALVAYTGGTSMNNTAEPYTVANSSTGHPNTASSHGVFANELTSCGVLDTHIDISTYSSSISTIYKILSNILVYIFYTPICHIYYYIKTNKGDIHYYIYVVVYISISLYRLTSVLSLYHIVVNNFKIHTLISFRDYHQNTYSSGFGATVSSQLCTGSAPYGYSSHPYAFNTSPSSQYSFFGNAYYLTSSMSDVSYYSVIGNCYGDAYPEEGPSAADARCRIYISTRKGRVVSFMDYHGYDTHGHGMYIPHVYGCAFDGRGWGVGYIFDASQIGLFVNYHFQYTGCNESGAENISTH